MARKPRILCHNFCYHITTRCNNREFRLTRYECRSVLLYAIKTEEIQAMAEKFVMANALNPEIARCQVLN